MTYLQIYEDVLALVLGAVFGSFINCMAWRIVHHESVLKGRSHCATCGHPLGAGDLVPVFSYICLKGRCRYCGEKISPRYMIVEVLNACAFLGIAIRYPLVPENLIRTSVISPLEPVVPSGLAAAMPVDLSFIRWMALVCVLLGLSLVDLDSQEIPDRFPVAGIIIWAATLPLMPESIGLQLKEGLIGAALIGGGLLVVSLLFDKISGKEGLGGGDIKLFFVTGLYFGPWTGLFHLILSCIVGLTFVAVMKEKKIPFGPAISIAAYICMLWGSSFMSWYFGLLGI